MSVYTEAEHAIALSDTLKWIEHPPISAESRYAYGLYHLRLKDYNEALHWLLSAAADGVEAAWFELAECIRQDLPDPSFFTEPLPDADSCYQKAFRYYSHLAEDADLTHSDAETCTILYRLAYLLRYGFGTVPDTSRAFLLFQEIRRICSHLSPDDFNVTCNYTIEGSGVSAATDVCKLPLGDACYELANYYLENIVPANSKNASADEITADKSYASSENHVLQANTAASRAENTKIARRLLKDAYDYHCEAALLLDFQLSGQDYASYEYPDDIRELYSFLIGQYGRVCDVHPSKKAYARLIAMYENGYPGDTGQRKSDFALKAKPLYKKM